MRYYIAYQGVSSSQGKGWIPLRGRQYSNRERADQALAAMEYVWNRRAENGYPWLAGQFAERYRIFEVPDGSTFAGVVNAIPGYYAITLGLS